MNRKIYDLPLDPNGKSESELITALYLYGDQVEVEYDNAGDIKNITLPERDQLLDSSLIRPELIIPENATNETQLSVSNPCPKLNNL